MIPCSNPGASPDASGHRGSTACGYRGRGVASGGCTLLMGGRWASAGPPQGPRVRTAAELGRNSFRQCRSLPVLKHGPRSLWSWQVAWSHLVKPLRVVKAKRLRLCQCKLAAERDLRSRSPSDRVSSACQVHGTRKVVNFTIPRRSHGKPWWRAVAVLTCKSCSLSLAKG